MADVCLTAPAVLSPISPNERRKRRHGYDSHVSEGCGANWYKRHRTGHSFARRLLHLRGFSLNVQQADELVRFIDQFPPEMDRVRALALACPFFFSRPSFPARDPRAPRVRAPLKPRVDTVQHPTRVLTQTFPSSNPVQDVSSILEKCGDIDDAIRQLTSLKLTAERKAARDDVATATNDAGTRPFLPSVNSPRVHATGVPARTHAQPPSRAADARPSPRGAIPGFQTQGEEEPNPRSEIRREIQPHTY